MPALARVKEQARTVGCLANLKQWSIIATMYAEENDGKIWAGIRPVGLYWPWVLNIELRDWKRNKIWFCPTAKKPSIDENGNMVRSLNIFNAWGIFRESVSGHDPGPNGIAGSYGLNSFLLSTPERQGPDRWSSLFTVPQQNRVPFFMDALRFDLWPRSENPPADYEFAAWTGENMARVCINRHAGYIGCVFLDNSARKVGLKELWTLKWNITFDTAGPWTRTGGIQSDDWPQWMRSLPEY